MLKFSLFISYILLSVAIGKRLIPLMRMRLFMHLNENIIFDNRDGIGIKEFTSFSVIFMCI